MNTVEPPIRVKRLVVSYADGSREECGVEAGGETSYRAVCRDSEVYAEWSGGVLSISASSSRLLSSFEPLELVIDASPESRVLVLTTHRGASYMYGPAFAYYNQLAIDRTPTSQKPDDRPLYPPQSFEDLDHVSYARRTPCWTFPLVVDDIDRVPGYSVFALYRGGGGFVSMLGLSSGSATAYIGPGRRIRVFTGRSLYRVSRSYIVSTAVGGDPYESIRECVVRASSAVGFRLREHKRRPIFMEGLGWCSWNALLTADLSHESVVRVVKGLLARGIPLSWVLIDDGWQKEVRGRMNARILEDLSADEGKFPKGLRAVVEDLKAMGVKAVGLWHTINIHWGGFGEKALRALSAQGFENPFTGAYIPPPTLEGAYKLYSRFFEWVRSQGFDFVKIDNQWAVHSLYWGAREAAQASRDIELALQVAAEEKGLDVLNCMSMAPENYCNFVLSNAMRVSEDYIPFWAADAKLHTLFSVYNSLLFSHIAYPDYDMWITYDPNARLHAVFRIFSGGPVYITDRHPEKSDVELLKALVSPRGELARPDHPGLPTRDLIFRNPYAEPVLLKVASRSRGCAVVAVANIYREGGEVRGSISIEDLPYRVEWDEAAYYMFFSRGRGTMGRGDRIEISLGELGVEVITICPIRGGKAVIGLENYLIPPSMVDLVEARQKILAIPRAPGKLLYYHQGRFLEHDVEPGEAVEV